MFSRPFKATCTMLASMTVSSSHIGGMQPTLTRYLICSAVPPLVELVTAQAASLRVLYSAVLRMLMRRGKMLASMMAWICCMLPAAMFDMVQQVSLTIVSFSAFSSWYKAGRALQLSTTCVCVSSPVTMLPTARRAADVTLLHDRKLK